MSAVSCAEGDGWTKSKFCVCGTVSCEKVCRVDRTLGVKQLVTKYVARILLEPQLTPKHFLATSPASRHLNAQIGRTVISQIHSRSSLFSPALARVTFEVLSTWLSNRRQTKAVHHPVNHHPAHNSSKEGHHQALSQSRCRCPLACRSSLASNPLPNRYA